MRAKVYVSSLTKKDLIALIASKKSYENEQVSKAIDEFVKKINQITAEPN
jgi:nucleoid DNA-binding protein